MQPCGPGTEKIPATTWSRLVFTIKFTEHISLDSYLSSLLSPSCVCLHGPSSCPHRDKCPSSVWYHGQFPSSNHFTRCPSSCPVATMSSSCPASTSHLYNVHCTSSCPRCVQCHHKHMELSGPQARAGGLLGFLVP